MRRIRQEIQMCQPAEKYQPATPYFFEIGEWLHLYPFTQREIYAKNNSINGGHSSLVNWSGFAYNLFESWLFWRLKNPVQYGWPPKNNLKPSTYVTNETNCGVCCQIKCTVFGEKCSFGKTTWTDIFLKKTCCQQTHERCSTLLNSRNANQNHEISFHTH